MRLQGIKANNSRQREVAEHKDEIGLSELGKRVQTSSAQPRGRAEISTTNFSIDAESAGRKTWTSARRSILMTMLSGSLNANGLSSFCDADISLNNILGRPNHFELLEFYV
jgi:hypothetical protein